MSASARPRDPAGRVAAPPRKIDKLAKESFLRQDSHLGE
jgi:hypothetical protein